MYKMKGQIWKVRKSEEVGSTSYKKARPGVICNDPRPGSTYVTIAPLSEFKGRVEEFQMYYDHKKPSIVHLENAKLVPVSSLLEYQGSMDEEAIDTLDYKLLGYYGLDVLSFKTIRKVKVLGIRDGRARVDLHFKRKKLLRYLFPMQALEEPIETKEELEAYFNTITGLNFLTTEGINLRRKPYEAIN